MITNIGERSNLILDPYSDSYFLIDISINRVGYLVESLGKLRAQGVKIILTKDFSQKGTMLLDQSLGEMILLSSRFDFEFARALRHNPHDLKETEKDVKVFFSERDKVIDLIQYELSDSKKTTLSSAEYFNKLTISIEKIFNINKQLNEILERKLNERVLTEKKELILLAIGLAVIIIMFILLQLIVSKSMIEDVEQIQFASIQVRGAQQAQSLGSESIAVSVREITKNSESVVEAAEQQQKVAFEIAKSAQVIMEETQLIAEDSSDLELMAREMEDIGKSLNAMVASFKY